MFRAITIGLSSVLLIVLPAHAQVIVHGNSLATDCYQKTVHGDPGRGSSIATCEQALEDFALRKKDRAATHINTAILYMRSEKFSKADKHYNDAIALMPDLSEAYISLAANQIYQGRFDEALEAVNKGIELGTDKMPEALYNRSIAYDRLGQYKEAYYDLKQALTLRPDWDVALKALGNYDVVSKPG